jgi:hypothetical protein
LRRNTVTVPTTIDAAGWLSNYLTHTVRYAGVTINAHTLDRATLPADLLAQVDELTDRVVRGIALPEDPEVLTSARGVKV